MFGSYYNDNDPGAAAWLRELSRNNLVPRGSVDHRPIQEVEGKGLANFWHCHFFAGVGGWAHALRLAGWPDDRPVWTGSCPCQPFSAAGKRNGVRDDRHLWPEFHRLVAECRPPVVFGEQVAGKAGLKWVEGVRADLEGEGYAVGFAVLGAHSVGAPHMRQRIYWVADAGHAEWRGPDLGRPAGPSPAERGQKTVLPGRSDSDRGLAHADGRLTGDGQVQPGGEHGQQSEDGGVARGVFHPTSNGREQRRAESGGRGAAGGCGVSGLGDPDDTRCEGRSVPGGERGDQRIVGAASPDASIGAWDRYDLIPCRDGKSRRVEPGVRPLAHGVPGRVGLLRGYGNAIVPQVAAQFIMAYLDTLEDR